MEHDRLLIVVEDFRLVFVMLYYPLNNHSVKHSIVNFISSKNKKKEEKKEETLTS